MTLKPYPYGQDCSPPSRPVFPLYIVYPSHRLVAKGTQALVYDHQGVCQYRLSGGRQRGATDFWRLRLQRETDCSAACQLFSALGSECGSPFRNETIVYDAEEREVGVLRQSMLGTRLHLYSDRTKLLRIQIGVIPFHITYCREEGKHGLELKRAAKGEVPGVARTWFTVKVQSRGGEADMLQLFCSMIAPFILTDGFNQGPVVD